MITGLSQILKYQKEELTIIEYEIDRLARRSEERASDLNMRKIETLMAISQTERLLEGKELPNKWTK